MSRPTEFSQDIADSICEALAEGNSLRSICILEDMPSKATVFRWLAAHTEFKDQYAHAREAQADTLFEETLEISDDARNDWMERHGDDDAGWQANGEHIQRSKLRVDTRKWMAGKLRPKVYGDKVINTHEGGDRPVEVSDVTPERQRAALALLLARDK